jgi:hypothetical protein
MTITQTIEIPADRCLRIKVPNEIPVGQINTTFTPVRAPGKKLEKSEERDIELFKLHAKRLNREALDVLSYQDDLF